MIHVIGIGVQGRASLGETALKLISRAGLLAGGRRHLDLFPDADAERLVIGANLEEAAVRLEAFLKKRRGGTVTVLATGDPLLFGIGSFMLKRFGKERVEVLPNVSTVQEAFARVKEPWTGAKVLSAHGRKTDLRRLCIEAASAQSVAIFTDPENTPARVAEGLLAIGGDCPAWVCESLGAPDERVRGGTLKAIARMRSFAPLNVMIVRREGAEKAGTRGPGIPDAAFAHRPGMITKAEYRVISISKMGIKEDSVVWDVGACSGSVSIEAALLAPAGRVYAVEKDPGRVRDMEKNVKAFGVGNVEVIRAEAPEALRALPGPDAVFVGGGGARITDILSCAGERLSKGGRLVVNAVSMETAARAIDFLKGAGWQREVTLINISKAEELGDLSLLKAHNPLFIISGMKP